MSNTYLNIPDYIAATDSELYNIINAAAAKIMLTSLKGKDGITFLIPSDPNTRAKLLKLASSMEAEDLEVLYDHIAAMTFRRAYKTPEDWKQQPVNCLSSPQKIKVRQITTDKVIFDNGAEAVLDKKFVDGSAKKCLAVWRLVKGEIPVTTNQTADLTVIKGSYETTYVDMTLRNKICIAIENKYAIQQLNKTAKHCVPELDAFVHATLSLVNYVANVIKNEPVLIERVLPLVSLNKIDLYYLIEPHRDSGEYLIDDNIINGWWGQKNIYTGFCCMGIINLIQKYLCSNNNSSLYSSRKQLIDAIHNIRKKIISTQSQPRKIIDNIEPYYQSIENNNSLEGVQNVYPDAMYQYYKNNPGLKLLQDELRYYTYLRFMDIERNLLDISEYNEIVNYIGECLRSQTQAERASNSKMLNKSTLKYLIAPEDYIHNIYTFINSNMFLFVPMTYDEVCAIKQKYSVILPPRNTPVLFNIIKGNYDKHSRIINTTTYGVNDENLINMLRNLDLSKIGEDTKRALLDKLNK